MAAPSRSPALALLSIAVLGHLAACSDALPSAADASASRFGRSTAAARPASPGRAARDFEASALHALLVPVLDAETAAPGRWADPSLSVYCLDASVTVDGAPPDVGAPVPDAFTIRWHMDRCTPLNPSVEVSGDVVVQVESAPGGYVARVVPERLTLRTAGRVEVLTEPFVARLTVGP